MLSTIFSFLVTLSVVSSFALNGKVNSRSIAMMAEKSQSVPFLDNPSHLKGLPGYKGFDPLGFSSSLPVGFLQEAGK